ncbi:MAG: hypothetical protein Q7S63_02425 [bacterium]|nr:hypothetical protein [bacterium]
MWSITVPGVRLPEGFTLWEDPGERQLHHRSTVVAVWHVTGETAPTPQEIQRTIGEFLSEAQKA